MSTTTKKDAYKDAAELLGTLYDSVFESHLDACVAAMVGPIRDTAQSLGLCEIGLLNEIVGFDEGTQTYNAWERHYGERFTNANLHDCEAPSCTQEREWL